MRRPRVAAAMLAIVVTGCAENPDIAAEPSVPDDAVKVGGQLYMIPIGEDDSGCLAYRGYSPTLAVVQAIHYRRPDGSFTMVREEANCDAIKSDSGSAPRQ